MAPAEIINTVLILGAAQGLFLTLLLATKRQNSVANRILAVAMLTFSVFILQSVYYERGYYTALPHFIGVSQPLVFLFGPILFMYARTVRAGGRVFDKRSLLHLLPFVAVALYFLPFYVRSGASKIAYLETVFGEGPPLDLAVVEQLQYPYGIFYALLTVLLIRRHRSRLQDTHSSIDRISLSWLRNLTVGIVAIWALATGLNVANIWGLGVGAMESRLTPLSVSILVYWLGYLGLRQPEIFHPPMDDGVENTMGRMTSDESESLGPVDLGSDVVPRERPGYEKSGLDRTEAEALKRRLLTLMEVQELYKEPLLTLPDLAGQMAVSPHNLSEVINTQIGKNFYDFVNGYRAEEVKRRLVNPSDSHLTILAVAEESGFNSKSSFNTFFRKYTGMTPSEYREIQNAKFKSQNGGAYPANDA